MTEQEIQEIFIRELEDQDTNRAVMNARGQVAVDILKKLAQPLLQEGQWELVVRMTLCKNRVPFFLNFFIENPSVKWPKKIMTDIIYLYESWMIATAFFCDNFENLGIPGFPEFNKFWKKDSLLKIRALAIKKCRELNKEFEEKKCLMMDRTEFKIMEIIFLWFQYLFLGQELYALYAAEYNAAVPILKKLQEELLSPEKFESEMRLPEDSEGIEENCR